MRKKMRKGIDFIGVGAGTMIFNSEGKAIAGISIAGPQFRMTRDKIDSEYIPAVKETAQKISRRMGFSGY